MGNADPASETARSRHSMDAMKPRVLTFSKILSLLASFRQDLPAKWQRWQQNSGFNRVSELLHEKIVVSLP